MEIRVGTVYSIVFAVVQIFDIFGTGPFLLITLSELLKSPLKAISYAKWSTVELETDGTPKNVVPEIDLGLFQICCITFIDNNNEDQSTSTELATTTASSSTSVRSNILREEPKEQQRECISWQKFYNAEKEYHENDTSEFVWDENCPNYGSRFWLHWPEDLVFVISSMAAVTSFLKIAFLSLSYLPFLVRSYMFYIVGVLNLASFAFQVFICVGWTIVVSQAEVDEDLDEGALNYSVFFWVYVISTSATFIFSFLMIYTYIQLRWSSRTSLNTFVRKIKTKTKVTLVSMNAELSREGFTQKFTKAKRNSEIARKSYKNEKRVSQRLSVSTENTTSTVKTIPFIPQLSVERASEEIREDVSERNEPPQNSLKIPTLQSNKFDLGSSPLRQRRLRTLQELNSELKESPLPVRTQRQTVKFAGIDPLEPEEKPQKQTGNEELLRSLDKETLAKLIMMTAAKESRASTRMQPIPMPTSYSMSADEDNEYV